MGLVMHTGSVYTMDDATSNGSQKRANSKSKAIIEQ